MPCIENGNDGYLSRSDSLSAWLSLQQRFDFYWIN